MTNNLRREIPVGQQLPARPLALTFAWLFALVAFFRWWEITLSLPVFLLWTALFLLLFIVTALVIHGRSARQRPDVVVRVLLWTGIVVLAIPALILVPVVTIRDTPVQTTAFAATLDFALPLWIVLSAMALLWNGWRRAAAIAAVPAILAACLHLFVIRMPGDSFAGPLPPLTPEQRARSEELEQVVRRLSVDIGDRGDNRPENAEAAARYLDSALTALGYRVTSQPFTWDRGEHRNLEVVIPGLTRPDETVIVGAHYDTFLGVPGADDNASGVAGVLDLARRFAGRPMVRTVKLVLFATEEPPFFGDAGMGSRVYAERAAQRDERIFAMIALETIGYYSTDEDSQHYPPPFSFFYPSRGDFIGFVGNLASAPLVRRSIRGWRDSVPFPSQGVTAPAMIPGITWSDHASFWLHGYPAFMITDTAPFRNFFYHTEGDTIDKLDFERMARVMDGIALVVKGLADED